MMISAWKGIHKMMRQSVTGEVRRGIFWVTTSEKALQGGIFKFKPEKRTETR